MSTIYGKVESGQKREVSILCIAWLLFCSPGRNQWSVHVARNASWNCRAPWSVVRGGTFSSIGYRRTGASQMSIFVISFESLFRPGSKWGSISVSRYVSTRREDTRCYWDMKGNFYDAISDRCIKPTCVSACTLHETRVANKLNYIRDREKRQYTIDLSLRYLLLEICWTFMGYLW